METADNEVKKTIEQFLKEEGKEKVEMERMEELKKKYDGMKIGEIEEEIRQHTREVEAYEQKREWLEEILREKYKELYLRAEEAHKRAEEAYKLEVEAHKLEVEAHKQTKKELQLGKLREHRDEIDKEINEIMEEMDTGNIDPY